MLKDPSSKYRPFASVDLPNRQWPSRRLTRVPVWCSTDLRDGNQALFEPMSRETKKRLFKTLCAVGLKEIEVGFRRLRRRISRPCAISSSRSSYRTTSRSW
jgi:2-isopropylmalate synthase